MKEVLKGLFSSRYTTYILDQKPWKGLFSTRYTTYSSHHKPWKGPLRTRCTTYIMAQFFCQHFVIIS